MDITIIDIKTGEITKENFTEEEKAERAKLVAERLEAIKQKEAEESAKIAAKNALLDRLGITEAEAKLLLP